MPVFVYWAQGLHAAPAIVQRCIADLQATTPRVTLLDESTRTAFSRLPATFVDRTQEWHRAHFAVGLRLDLLARYGGVWVDATCLCRTDIRRTATELVSQAPMFAFTYGASRISSWFLIARPGSRLIGMLRAALFLWWETEGYLIDYFQFHHLFEVLTYLDDQCGAEWAQVARRDSRVPHRVQRAMFDDTDPAGDLELLNSSFIHKLKYQYTPESVPLNSLLARLLRGSHRPNGSEPV